ncbi:MAG: hypothetical protein HeimC2_17370 [Candidatus Heimdallarchaeota archaeon LC_2]|nr:MAG: hypothetical protein HeimC2_17370 [Candidatus Heimdallarchaeota archaeon LC_2]
MGLTTWTRNGSEKAQASQTIRILMKSLQYLAENAVNDENQSQAFINTAHTVIKDLFTPSPSHSNNEQVVVLLGSMGWKNAQIEFSSGNEAKLILGSNRHLDQETNSVKGLKLLVTTISKALGYHILSREVDAYVEIDILAGPIYNINIKALTKNIDLGSDVASPATRSPEIKPAVDQTSNQISVAPISSSQKIDTTQIFLPVLTNKYPLSRLHLLLKDVLAEFCNSWYSENPLDTNDTGDEKENVALLMNFLVQKTIDNNASTVDAGVRLGTFFANAIKKSFPNIEQPLTQEIIDGAAVGSMIRDIKARAFCYLNPGDKCGPNIGDENRSICDFSMGIWQGTLSELGDHEFKFSGFYAAGRRDPYCLMEFEVQ